MRTKLLLTVALMAMLLTGIAVIGSNMGFKISIPLTTGYTNFVALPYYNSYVTALDVYTDVGATCTEVSRWDDPTAAWVSYTGGRGTGFNLNKAEALVIKVNTTGPWVVVGSHDPGYAVPLTTGYTNFVSIPYHTNKATAADIYGEVANCTEVSRWDDPTAAWVSYTGGRGTGFNLTSYEGVVIKVSTTGTWTPAHY